MHIKRDLNLEVDQWAKLVIYLSAKKFVKNRKL
jgi:hypothetical protein